MKIVNWVLMLTLFMPFIVGCSDQAPSEGETTGAVENVVEDVVIAVESATELAPAADTVLLNGKILTVDETFSVAQAIAIKAGRIIAIGSEDDIAIYSNDAAEVIDLQGKTVIPGLIDNHMHFHRAMRYWDQELIIEDVNERNETETYAEEERALNEFEEILIKQNQANKKALNAISAMNAAGVTSIYDAGLSEDGDIAILKNMSEQASLNIRVWHSLRYQFSDLEGIEPVIELIKAVKPNDTDDSLGTFGIGQHAYLPLDNLLNSDEFDVRNELNKFSEVVLAAAQRKFRVTEASITEATVNSILDIYEVINQEVRLKPLRWSLANVRTMSDESIQRANSIGLTVTLHSVANDKGGSDDEAIERLQPPIRKLQDSGMIFGLGSGDAINAHYQPFITLGWAITGRFQHGVALSALNNRLTREEALIAHTRSNAYLLFKDKELGSLEVGKLADLVVLDKDYMTVPEDEIFYIKPTMTMLEGRKVYVAP